MNSRREAIFIVTRWLETKDFPDRLFTDSPERPFITDLVYTTVRRYRSLDWALSRFVKKLPKSETHAALLVGACQLLYMPDVAEYAAVNETVEAAKQSSRAAGGLVNGVLRNLLRQRPETLDELGKQSIGLRTSHPDSLVTRWTEHFGAEETLALCEWDNKPAETYLAYPPGSEEAFVKLPRGERVESHTGFLDGAFIVQDPATAAAVSLLGLRPGLRVLDACAAPGGKTVQIAWRMKQGDLIALDLHEDRLATVRANLERTHQTWVKVEQGDLTNLSPELRAKLGLFDRILIDAPCSNTGVLRRRADARWRWTAARMKQLAQTQAKMLESALSLLAPGGRIVYSTCSLEPEENRRQIALFRKAHPEMACVGVEERIPTRSGTDGAFAAALEKA